MKNWELAYQDYKAGMKYKDIAEKYGVSINTVKSWKSRKWNELDQEKENATTPEKVAHKEKKVAHKPRTKPIIENENLTEQQKMFCLYYLQHFTAAKAYRQAYPDASYNTARVNSSKLLTNTNVKAELDRLKAELQADIYVDIKDLIQEYTKQAFADITDFVDFGTETIKEEVPLSDIEITDDVDEDGLPVINNTKTVEYKYSYVNLKNAEDVDGTVIQEVKKGKDGVSVKLYDKQKAMQMLMEYFESSQSDTEKQRVELEMLKAKLKLIELDVSDSIYEEDDKDDGFLDALNAEGAELWPEE